MITGDRKLTVRVAGPRDSVRKLLRSIEGVRFADVTVQAEKGSYDFLVEARPNVDIRKPMFAALAKAGYPILQLKSMDLSLEDIFLKLVEEKKKQRDPHNKAPKKVPGEVALNVSGGESAPEYPEAAPGPQAEEQTSPEIESKEEDN